MTTEELMRIAEERPHEAQPTPPVQRETEADGTGWPEPERLGEELPPVPPFDPELLPASMRAMVVDVTERLQVPLDYPAIVCVATLAGLTNRRALIQPKRHDTGWAVVPNLWGAIIGPPGVMKSPVVSAVTAPVRALETEWRKQNDAAMAEYNAAAERAELDKAAWKEQYKRNIKAGKEAPERPDANLSAPVPRQLLTADANFEALHKLMSENPAGILLLRDELTGWLAGLERQGREQERSFFLEAWNGDQSFTINRIERGNIHVSHACVSLFGGIQPSRLRSYLADTLADGPSNDGLIQRFQLMVWPDIPRTWNYIDRRPNDAAMESAGRVYRRIVGLDAEKPLRLQFEDAAQEVFILWLTELEQKMRGEESTIMQAHLSKYRKLMPALALLFSLADEELNAVSLRHAQQACYLCEYLEAHARRVYAARISVEQLAASDLGKRLVRGWKRAETSFTLRDVYGNHWSGLSTPEEARPAVQILESYGWLRKEPADRTKGRPSELYAINPRIYTGDKPRIEANDAGR
jgi:hypothetical protein